MAVKWVRKAIISLLLVLCASFLMTSLVQAKDDPVGLLNGKTIKTGSRIDNILGSTTLVTDDNESTYFNLVHERSDASVKDMLIYQFASPTVISAYKMQILNYNNGPIYMLFYNSNGTIIGSFSKQVIKGDSNIYNFPKAFTNVSKVMVYQASTITYQVAELNFYNTVPDAPLNLEATAGDSNATLSWETVEGADSYTIYYGMESGKYTSSVSVTSVVYGDYTIPGLTNGATYYFVVSAMEDGLESGYSNEVAATPAAALADPTLYVTIDDEKVVVGQEFVANISLKNVENIYAEDFTINYDTGLFEFVGYEEVTGYKVYNDPVDKNGSIRFIIASQGKDYGINEDTVIVKLKFRAIATGTGDVDALKGRIADIEREFDLDEENCLLDTVTVEEAPLVDVNKSGEYTLVDLAIDGYYYGKAAADTDTVLHNADQIIDGYVNDGDLVYIVSQMLANPNYSPNL
ncbi:cohesin domain-containing protein [Paenibacillus oralis]|nr:cohesin domain-containing protein [Paenibacillus oralis]